MRHLPEEEKDRILENFSKWHKYMISVQQQTTDVRAKLVIDLFATTVQEILDGEDVSVDNGLQ